MLLQPATTIAKIRENCLPSPLKDKQLEAFFVETVEARNDKFDLREELKLQLEQSSGIRRILLCGHRGCGKSTELNKLKTEMGEAWFVVSFSISEYLPPINVRAEDVLLAVAMAVFDRASTHGNTLDVHDSLLKGVYNFFTEKTTENIEDRSSEMAASSEIGVGSGFWTALISVAAKFKSDLKVGSRTSTTVVSTLRQRPGDLVVALNLLLEAVRVSLDKDGKRLLILVEDLDKLGLADAREIFIYNGQLLAGLNTNVIYTIPLFTFHSPDAGAISALFDATLTLPMLKVVDVDGNKASGFDVIKEIVRKRVSSSILPDEALSLIINGTGGVLRNVFEVLQLICSYRSIRGGPIEVKHVRDALLSMSTDIGLRIGWPFDPKSDEKNPDILYSKLADIAYAQSQGQRVPPTNDKVVQILLQSGALIEYNGRRWLGVHPLARKYLVDLGYTKVTDPLNL